MLLAVLVGLASLALVEVGMRLLDPPMRAQMIRAGPDLELRNVEGVPLWRGLAQSPARWNLSCRDAHPDARGVVFVGSSILAGVALEAEQTLSAALQRRFDADPPAGPPLCMHNLSQPAFAFDQKLAVTQQVLPQLSPAVLVWELWGTDTARYVWVGDAAMRSGALETGPDGLPNPLRLPTTLNAWLLSWSRTWLQVDVGLSRSGARQAGQDWDEIFEQGMPRVLDLARRHGAQVLLLAAPPLDRSFRASLAENPPQVRLGRALAEQHDDVHFLRIEGLLADDDFEALRLDPCCHYVEAGHSRIAETLDPHLRALLGDRSARPDPHDADADDQPPMRAE